MKKYFFRLTALLISLYPLSIFSQINPEQSNSRLLTAWQKMIPRYAKIQFAGGMGLLSAGVGWNYGHNKSWETEVLWGFVPTFSNDETKITMTLRENYIPWSVRLGRGWSLQPLSCGIYMNTVFDGNFWIKEPLRYPSGYYSFSTKIRTHAYLGQRISFYDKKLTRRTMSLFYELSTCDLYIINACSNRYVRLSDILSLSFGFRIQLI